MQVREYQIISPPFACGVSWLANILLELNIKTTNSFIENHWTATDVENSFSCGTQAYSYFKWCFPILHEKTNFVFPEPIEVFWEHRLDLAKNFHRPTILFLRDPRDAIHSLFCRNYANIFSFDEYLNRPDKWPDHFPEMFDLPPAETMALFCFFWYRLKNKIPLLVIRFEDMRKEPIDIVFKILKFLNIHRSVGDVEDALSRSSFSRLKKLIQDLSVKTEENFNFARKGQVGEWRAVYSLKQLKNFNSKPVRYIMNIFGYSANVSFLEKFRQFYRITLKSKVYYFFYKKYIINKSKAWCFEVFGEDSSYDELKELANKNFQIYFKMFCASPVIKNLLIDKKNGFYLNKAWVKIIDFCKLFYKKLRHGT